MALMWKDEIVEEVRNARLKISAEHGHDLGRIVEDLRRRQVTSGHKVVSLEPRQPQLLRRVSGSSGK
jgi:hypothetical protein